MTGEELRQWVTDNGFPAFRAVQIGDWLGKGVTNFDEMRNLPADLKKKLQTSCYISVATIAKKQVSRYDKTVKYLFSFHDGECVEAVLMSYHHGYSICISTQVGCKMGCTFCATGKSGFSRSLTASEMLAQIEAAQRDEGVRISNVVLMGMGEPLDNFDNVVRFLHLAGSQKGLHIGMRHITLSTCGIVPKIYELAQCGLPVNLETTGRRVTFEYALISGVNDTDACARELGHRLRGMNCHVNLIPVNSVAGTGYQKSNVQRQQSFADILAVNGITATVRRTLGSDIDASCGQLRRKHLSKGGQSLGNFQ